MRVDVTRVVKCRKGLSIVAMTLILLVISILLALIATLYGLNIITNRLPGEDLSIPPDKRHIWFNSTSNWSEAGFVVRNIGGRDVVLNKIEVRDQLCAWSTIYYWKTNTVTTIDEINVETSLSGAWYNIMVQGELRNFTRASDKLTLKSGWTIVLYIVGPISDKGYGDTSLTVSTAINRTKYHQLVWSQFNRKVRALETLKMDFNKKLVTLENTTS